MTQRSAAETLAQTVARVQQALESAGLHYGHGSDNAADEAWFLVLQAAGIPFELGEDLLDEPVSPEQQTAIDDWLQRRINLRLPLPYIAGEAWFCGLPFTINRHVLIPRSPIAELIERQFQPWLSQPPQRILDLCTGSGCIGIACALAFPETEVHLADLSPQAVQVAELNIQRYELAARVQVFESDLFSGLPAGRYDLIVTNPPYVDARDMAELPAEFHHEPVLGLTAGDDGLDLVRRILAEAANWLTEDGWLICEVGNSQPALEAAFPLLPFIWLEFDYGGDGVFAIAAADLRAAFKAPVPVTGGA